MRANFFIQTFSASREKQSESAGSTTMQGLPVGTLVVASIAVMVAQISLATPATLNGLFQQDLHPVGSQLTWISDAFLLPVAALELSFGVLGDLFGRKLLLVIGGVLLTAGEFVASAAPVVQVVWVGQALAGLGAGAVFPTSLAMLVAGTHTTRDRSRSIALWAGFLSAGGVIAPVLGGITGSYGSWRWSLIVVGILGVVSIVLGLAFATDSRAPEGRSLDWGGQVTLAVGLIALLYSVIQGPTDGWTDTAVIAGFVVAAVFLALFVVAESRAASPMLRLDLFSNRAFAVASAVAVIGMFSFLGTAYATSIRLGPVQFQSPLRTAVPFLLLQGPAFVLIPLTSWLLQRVNPRWLLGSGFLFMAAGQFAAATVPIADTTLTSLVVPIGLVGIGFALAVTSITATAVNTVPIHYAGMASAATSLLRDFGFTLGPAVIGAVALGEAGARFTSTVAGAGLPAGEVDAARSVAGEGGPLAVNAIMPGQPGAAAHQVAYDALGHGFAVGFAVCGAAALFAAVLTVAAMRGGRSDNIVRREALIE
ncbi:MFS transporter [Pseudonocardia xinjiangensis]